MAVGARPAQFLRAMAGLQKSRALTLGGRAALATMIWYRPDRLQMIKTW